MNVISLDAIVRNTLMRRRYPIHWYIDFMVYAKDALRNLTLDDLRVVNYKKLPVDTSINAVDLPSDFSGKIGVYVPFGQRLRPLVEDTSITPLYNYDSSFEAKPYNTEVTPGLDEMYTQYFIPSSYLMVNVNQFGENTGRYFGGVSSMGSDTYRIIKSRNQIQLNELIVTDHIVLCYVSNGMDVDSASKVDGMAQDTIEAYILWQMKEHSRTYSDMESERAKQNYIDERKILRARLNDMDLNTLARIIQRNTRAMK